MKIAIPTREDFVDDHFGHCEYFSIYTISSVGEIEKEEVMKSPEGCGCKSDIAITLKQMGVEIMLAGNMGQGAVNKVSSIGIKVVRGCSGKVHDIVENYLKGGIVDTGLTCEINHNHDSGHKCNHN